ncbi:MAG: alanine--glyoxylate aminotransferase family protein, partial [Odoribacter splanchnicus]|nr:alanine--glyoxylate aminotransferase family protein [Odoribacter splanchnicus]
PEKMGWKKLDTRLREEGLVVGGNYGCLAGEVFRIGHMGSQADPELVREAMDIIERVVKQ